MPIVHVLLYLASKRYTRIKNFHLFTTPKQQRTPWTNVLTPEHSTANAILGPEHSIHLSPHEIQTALGDTIPCWHLTNWHTLGWCSDQLNRKAGRAIWRPIVLPCWLTRATTNEQSALCRRQGEQWDAINAMQKWRERAKFTSFLSQKTEAERPT